MPEETIWQLRVRKTLDDLVEAVVNKDTHSTKSEFIRQAVREKLEKMGVKFNVDISTTDDEFNQNGSKEKPAETTPQ